MFDSEGFRRVEAFEDGADFRKARAAACYYFGRRLYTAVNESTTFEVQDRPYATILKSVPSHP